MGEGRAPRSTWLVSEEGWRSAAATICAIGRPPLRLPEPTALKGLTLRYAPSLATLNLVLANETTEGTAGI